ncbi:hypothetical protein J437_LFUL015281 [Ladona fulva]|uniref:Uncharacterized protein n=1 Tax=Ladona fulva TaxID=123851 RepID=A0A8K0KQ27_LADFU|nr:hypothetical protein J437_LFUL015281 [Ladona fulva]
MRPDCRSISFAWQRGSQNSNPQNTNLPVRRRNLDKFENVKDPRNPFTNERSLRSTLLNFTLPAVSVHSRQAVRVGAERISKTLRDVRVTFDSLSQKFRRSTRRRVPLKNELSPRTPNTTPRTRSRRLLGRTPTKLYSPFGIDTPRRREGPHQRRSSVRGCHDNEKPISNPHLDAYTRHISANRRIF